MHLSTLEYLRNIHFNKIFSIKDKKCQSHFPISTETQRNSIAKKICC